LKKDERVYPGSGLRYEVEKAEHEEGKGKKREGGKKEDLPGITTFLTSLLTMRTSDSDLCPFLPGWGDVFSIPSLPFLSVLVLVMMRVVVVLMVRGRDCTVREE
jgi:hypothetical protein